MGCQGTMGVSLSLKLLGKRNIIRELLMNISIVTIIGIIASIGTAMSMVPQLLKLKKENKAEDISLNMLLVLFIGLRCWIVYGTLQKDWIITISNSFSYSINILPAVLALNYKKKVII